MVELTARDLVSTLGDVGLVSVAGVSSRAIRSVLCTIHDPLLPLPSYAAGILLAVGVGPDSAAECIAAAGASGYDAVVLRLTGFDIDDVTRAAYGSGIAVFGIGLELGWSQLERLLSTTLMSANAASSNRESTLFDLADAIASLIGGAILIEDSTGRTVAYSNVEGYATDAEHHAAITGAASLHGSERPTRLQMLAASPVPLELPALGDGLPRFATAARIGEETIGFVSVIDDGNLSADKQLLLVHARELVALQLLQLSQVADFEREHRASLVRTVIVGGHDAHAAIRRLGESPGDSFTVLAFAAESEAAPAARISLWPRFWSMLITYLSAWQPSGGMCVLEGRTYVLLRGTIAEDPDRIALNAELLVERAAGFGLGIRVGIGSAVANVDAIVDSREEADALALALAMAGDSAVLTAARNRSRLALWFLIRAARDQHGLHAASVQRLIRHDADHGTEYTRTWSAWFASGMDLQRTAAALAVHRNTLRYRLQRADEIAGITDDPDDRLVAWLTLRMMEIGESRMTPAG